MTEEMKKKLETTQRRMMRMIIQTKRKSGKCLATHTSRKSTKSPTTNPTARGQPPRPRRARRKQQQRRQQPLPRRNLKRQSRRRARTEDRQHNESNAQSGRLASNKRNYVVDPQAEPDLSEAKKDDCQTHNELEDELEPWVDKIVRATRKADNLLAPEVSSDRAGKSANKRE